MTTMSWQSRWQDTQEPTDQARQAHSDIEQPG
jgi:hypothetical protein